jgi:hypothetical protein
VRGGSWRLFVIVAACIAGRLSCGIRKLSITSWHLACVDAIDWVRRVASFFRWAEVQGYAVESRILALKRPRDWLPYSPA